MLRSGSRWAGPALACALLAIVHTWPLATAPGTLSRNDNGDAQLNEWIMAWVAHQLPRDPAHLFQGNIFYPAPDTLAYSEPLIVPALIGAPVAWLGGSPVLVFNLMVMTGFTLTALAAYRARAELDGRPGREPARRGRVRVQYAHADPARARAGAAHLRPAARAPRDRPDHHRNGQAKLALAGVLDGRDGLHVGVLRRLRGRHDRRRARRARSRMVVPRGCRADLTHARRDRRSARHRAAVSAVSARGAHATHGTPARGGARVSPPR